MNYSVAHTALKIAEYEDQIEYHEHQIRYHQAEISRRRKEIKDLRSEPVLSDEGEIVSYSDIER
ncbi:hypothetical protein AM228_01645 [Planktothricoides sp. SR001]|nr:hypothetical protein AM228_01645 [Planktothricoides sp. SR001]